MRPRIFKLNPGVSSGNLRVGQLICVPSPRTLYLNREYKVSFTYPSDWRQVEEGRYEGSDGFFLVTATGGGTDIGEVCRNEASHVLQPYGSSPTIQRLTVQGQEACLILPAADQPQSMRGQSALIVRYPEPVTIGGQVYPYFVLYADQNHIREFAASLRFLP